MTTTQQQLDFAIERLDWCRDRLIAAQLLVEDYAIARTRTAETADSTRRRREAWEDVRVAYTEVAHWETVVRDLEWGTR